MDEPTVFCSGAVEKSSMISSSSSSSSLSLRSTAFARLTSSASGESSVAISSVPTEVYIEKSKEI